MPWVRPAQIALRVSTRSISSSVSGNVLMKARSPSTKRSGMSAIMPPTRVRLVVRRAPVHLLQVENQLALLERPQERCERAEIDRGRAEPHHVRDDAAHLARDHAQHAE